MKTRLQPLLRVLVAAGLLVAVASPATEVGAQPPRTAAPSTVGAESVAFGSSTIADSAGRYLVQYQSAAGLLHSTAALTVQGVVTDDVSTTGIYVATVEVDAQRAERLRSTSGVVAVEPDHILTASTSQSSPPSWGLDRLDQRALPLDSSYTYTATGAGVTAYVIDTGLRMTHTEFTGRVPRSAYHDFGDGTLATDCHGHGTHVAGTLGGTTYGVAKEVTIIPVKIGDCTGQSTNSIMIAGINWVIADHVAGIPAVANISFGGAASSFVDAAINALIADGVTVVVAAGNDAAPTCGVSPARAAAAITVAASDSGDNRASYSNYGSCNDIFAPGSNILSAYFGSDTGAAYGSGTSMASPHVAGVAALMLQDNPTATPAAIWTALSANATTGAVTGLLSGDPNKLLSIPGVAPTGPAYVPLSPARLMDTRPGEATIDMAYSGIGQRPAGSVTELVVTGRGGVDAAANAVVLNVTIVSPTGGGFATIYPCGTTQPTASNLNYTTGQTIPNAVIAKIGTAGKVCLYTNAPTQFVVDVAGYFTNSPAYVPLSPARLMDTRPGEATIDMAYSGIGQRPAGSVTELVVTGRGGVDAAANAVVLNVTIVSPTGGGFATIYPCGTTQPTASNLNYTTGQTIPNAVIAKIGTAGKVCLYTNAPTQFVVDVAGYF